MIPTHSKCHRDEGRPGARGQTYTDFEKKGVWVLCPGLRRIERRQGSDVCEEGRFSAHLFGMEGTQISWSSQTVHCLHLAAA